MFKLIKENGLWIFPSELRFRILSVSVFVVVVVVLVLLWWFCFCLGFFWWVRDFCVLFCFPLCVFSNSKFEQNLIYMLPGAQEITLTFQLKITCRQLLIYPEVLCISLSLSIHISYIWMIWYDISYICMIWYIIYIRICTPAATSDIAVTCMGKILAQIYIVVRTGHGKFGTCLLFRVLPSLCCAFMQ